MAAKISAKSLGIDVESGEDHELFKWFLASYLFGKRISQQIAANTYKVLVDQHHLDSPRKLGHKTWQQLVDLLGEGHYKRYDESTASRLLEVCKKLEHDYGGSLHKLHAQAGSRGELRRRLLEFKGVGPKTAQIYLREAATA
jgi:3-methyladenine DNA glycosylase/8-oxoguanine DNA glycosylase